MSIYLIYRMPEDDKSSLPNRTYNNEEIQGNQFMTKSPNMAYSHDGMRYRGESRPHESHQVTR